VGHDLWSRAFGQGAGVLRITGGGSSRRGGGDRVARALVHDDRLRPGRHPQPEAEGPMSLLEIEDLRITYQTKGGPVPAVRGVTMAVVERGQVMGLAGGIRVRQVHDRGERSSGSCPRPRRSRAKIVLDGEEPPHAVAGSSAGGSLGGAHPSCSRGAQHALNSGPSASRIRSPRRSWSTARRARRRPRFAWGGTVRAGGTAAPTDRRLPARGCRAAQKAARDDRDGARPAARRW